MAGHDLNILNYLEAGVRAEGARQKAIASNIANINTPGYRRLNIRFEEVLGRA
jgi:flagellar basal-body rod protein FlgB